MWPILTRKDSILYIHYIQHIQKNISVFEAKTPHSQKLINSFPSKLTKIYIRGPFAKPFFELSPQCSMPPNKSFLHYTRESPIRTKKGEKKIPQISLFIINASLLSNNNNNNKKKQKSLKVVVDSFSFFY